MRNTIILEAKTVGDISGHFFVPSYQRGYRWGSNEVFHFLDDIYATNGEHDYFLQPIVLKKIDDKYELIDGQQRLTTIYLIYQYMHEESNGFIDSPKFTIEYETRTKSLEFLKSVDETKKEENIDFWHIAESYRQIKEWFQKKEKKSTITNLNKYFDERVKIIWYEIDKDEDSIGIFTRLNIGKIPLANSELVKAMFLCKEYSQSLNLERQTEISQQWDNIEKELHNDSFWYFLSNKNYEPRIDLLLDLIVKKPNDCKDSYYSFFKFDELRKKESLIEIWNQIQHAYLMLKGWYENHDLYHKIGYLICSNSLTLQEIFNLSIKLKKNELIGELDAKIKDSININENYSELSYRSIDDQKKMSKLLLLFNVESVRTMCEKSQRFPFDKHKRGKDGSIKWSLEHIHAQHSISLKTEEQWREWLNFHLKSLRQTNEDNSNDSLIQSIEEALAKNSIQGREFDRLQNQVVEKLSERSNAEYEHTISNLALLSTNTNAALNNSTFDVKRNEIVEMDKKGDYIPYCTRMVFLKYYTPSDKNQLHFWGYSDRVAYINAINKKLEKYLAKKIDIDEEGE